MSSVIGTHFLLDGYVKSDAVFTEKHILEVIDDIINVADMTYLGDPIVRDVPTDKNNIRRAEDDGGISILVPITTSHISAHCWPLRKLIMLDIFSCKPFNAEVIERILKASFNFSRYKTQFISRRDPVATNDTQPIFPWNRIPSF